MCRPFVRWSWKPMFRQTPATAPKQNRMRSTNERTQRATGQINENLNAFVWVFFLSPSFRQTARPPLCHLGRIHAHDLRGKIGFHAPSSIMSHGNYTNYFLFLLCDNKRRATCIRPTCRASSMSGIANNNENMMHTMYPIQLGSVSSGKRNYSEYFLNCSFSIERLRSAWPTASWNLELWARAWMCHSYLFFYAEQCASAENTPYTCT